MKMEQTECSETSAYKIQSPRNYPEESIKQLRKIFCKFTYKDTCELFGKSLQRNRRNRQEGDCSVGKVSFITDRSPPNEHRLYQMTVRYVKCSFKNVSFMETEIHLTKNFDIHEHRP